MNGKDAEYWAGTYGAFWKDMDLHVWKKVYENRYSLIDDVSEWRHTSGPNPDYNDDLYDSRGKMIHFRSAWSSVTSSI